MKKLKIYVDTSVFGGCFDKEFETLSRQLFSEIVSDKFRLVISETTFVELSNAPQNVQDVLLNIPSEFIENVPLTSEIETLRDAYITAGIVGTGSLKDAEHIAAASVSGVDLIVSWNFKHIVHFQKIRGYHSVNLALGYPQIPIYSPREVIEP